ncbi:MAG: hypothetical protein AAF204_02205 [Pseudomonadota bacterium]
MSVTSMSGFRRAQLSDSEDLGDVSTHILDPVKASGNRQRDESPVRIQVQEQCKPRDTQYPVELDFIN